MAFLETISDLMILPAVGKAIQFTGDEVLVLSSEAAEPERLKFEKYSNMSPDDSAGLLLPKDSSKIDVLRALSTETRRTDFRFFFLASLDVSLDIALRFRAAEFVEDFLQDQELGQYAEGLVCTEVFHPTLDGELVSQFRALARYSTLIAQAKDHEQAADDFWRSWQALVEETDPLTLMFPLGSLRDSLLGMGFALVFIRAVRNSDLNAFNNAIVSFAYLPAVRRQYGSVSRVMNSLRGILERRKAFGKTQLKFPSFASLQSEEETREADYYRPTPDHEIYAQVTKQIESIKKLLFTGSQSLVERSIRELLDFQRERSESEYFAKTLCNLAAVAVEANEIPIAKRLADEATTLGVEDIVIENTAANVTKKLGNFQEAINRYEAALLKFGRERYTLNGLADALNDAGQYQRALSIYESSEAEFPDDPVAPNGIATVYLDMGNATLALRKAKQNVAVYGDVVSRIICGNTLRHLGRNHESLKLMQESIRVFPSELRLWSGLIRSLGNLGIFAQAEERCDDFISKYPESPIPWNLKGELLRKSGRLDDGLTCYDKALLLFPANRTLHSGKATMLLLADRAKEAQDFVNTPNPQSEIDWKAYHIWASTFARLGEYTDALRLLRWGLANVPWKNLQFLFSSTIGYVNLRMGKPTEAITIFKEALRDTDQSTKLGIFLLLGRAYSDIGAVSKSRQCLDRVQSNVPTIVQLRNSTRPGIRLVRDSKSLSRSIETNEFQILLHAA